MPRPDYYNIEASVVKLSFMEPAESFKMNYSSHSQAAQITLLVRGKGLRPGTLC